MMKKILKLVFTCLLLLYVAAGVLLGRQQNQKSSRVLNPAQKAETYRDSIRTALFLRQNIDKTKENKLKELIPNLYDFFSRDAKYYTLWSEVVMKGTILSVDWLDSPNRTKSGVERTWKTSYTTVRVDKVYKAVSLSGESLAEIHQGDVIKIFNIEQVDGTRNRKIVKPADPRLYKGDKAFFFLDRKFLHQTSNSGEFHAIDIYPIENGKVWSVNKGLDGVDNLEKEINSVIQVLKGK